MCGEQAAVVDVLVVSVVIVVDVAAVFVVLVVIVFVVIVVDVAAVFEPVAYELGLHSFRCVVNKLQLLMYW